MYNKYLAKRIDMYEQHKETFSYVQCANDMKKLKLELGFKGLFILLGLFERKIKVGEKELCKL